MIHDRCSKFVSTSNEPKFKWNVIPYFILLGKNIIFANI